MIGLDTCLKKSGIIKKDITITTFEEAENVAKCVAMGDLYNITFEKSSLKQRFFTILKEKRNDLCIINCSSKESRLKEDINNSFGLIVYDNISNYKNSTEIIYFLNKVTIC